MTTFRITSSAGQDLGTYKGETAADALDAMAQDAGYRDQADAAQTVGAFDGKVEVVPSAAVTSASPHTIDGIRFFLGADTKQVSVNPLQPVDPESWYYEPFDYHGDVLWSDGYSHYADAREASRKEREEDGLAY